MTTIEQQKLGKTLWDIANELRGSMMADDFRDYMLSFLFLRYLSENYTDAAKKELGGDYPLTEEIEVIQDDNESKKKSVRVTPLSIWYKENSGDTDEFEKQMRRKVHYVIEPEYLWLNIYELARTQNEDLLKTLEEGFKYIENKSFENAFKGLFSEINLSSDKLGKDYPERNKLLCKVITRIAKGIANFSTDTDILGDAYEYLIGEFAAGSGQKAGEFYTPQEISTVLSRIATLDSQDPKSGERKKIEKVFDFTCGSGSLLLNVRRILKKGGGDIGKIYGQEKNITTYNLARMNMLLHGVKDSEFEIHHGDSLLNDWSILSEMNPAHKIKFDAIVANPPFSYRWDPSEEMEKDFRFNSYGLAPKSAADFAFLLHGFHFLKKDGVMAIILPHGVLFRGGKEEAIRKKLLIDGNIDTVIGLPSNLFFSTGIPVCILILKKCKRTDDVLFINATGKDHFEKVKRQNKLRTTDIDKIIDTYKNRNNEIRYSRCVSMSEIEKNDYNLNISRYVSTTEAEETVDINEVNKKLVAIEERISNATMVHNTFLKELGLPLIPVSGNDRVIEAMKNSRKPIKSSVNAFLFLSSLNLLNAAVKKEEYKDLIGYGFIKPAVARFIQHCTAKNEINYVEEIFYSEKEQCAYIRSMGIQFSFHSIGKERIGEDFINSKNNNEVEWDRVRLQPIALDLYELAKKCLKENICDIKHIKNEFNNIINQSETSI